MEIISGYGATRMKSMPDETQKKFYLKNGELNRYSFAYGYIQWVDFRKKQDDHCTRLELWQDELWQDGCFHVRAHDHEEKGRLFWESFDSLTEARKFFHKKRIELSRTE